ncbi:aminotransferase-like domain-containing protein [Paenibacillus pedocola]|uniref:aminotransferase-like domain-containing protein n=1 Tax=Paenibacillus pedocola TaxID=3242193 RepID=UPI002877B16A|nr:PLP-dependent aminotransferase family protein [Paenibacillus typhae]
MRKYDKVLMEMEQQISGGSYRSGHKLPSVRSAAARYGCSVSTVIRAYRELEQKHVIYSIPQSGYYVVEQPGEESVEAEDGTIDFGSASPDLNVFPYLDFQHCLNQAIDTYKYHLFTYGETQGLAALRQTLVPHLADAQVFAAPGRIFITSGVQQALGILAKMPFPNGKETVLVEQPSYDIYLRFLEAEGIPVSGIPRSGDGIDLQLLEEYFRTGGIKFFYTMSRYHNPLGTSYTKEERQAIARLAGKYDVYVVEDDYMADLGDSRPFDPIAAFDRSGHVIYLKSFSKIIFPGLSLGAAVLPETLLPVFQAHKSYMDTSLLSQAALDIYIKNGMYERHKHKIRSLYAERMARLNEALQRYNSAGLIEAPGVDSGIYIQMKLPQTVNLEHLEKRLHKRKIRVVSGKGFYLSGYLEREKFLRISISRARPEQIATGVAAIVEETAGGGWW